MNARVPKLSDPRQQERLFVATTPGLELALEQEVRRLPLGCWRVPGGVEVQGPPGLHRTLNLRLRTASRVLLRLSAFEAKDASALDRGLRQLRLADYHRPGQGELQLQVHARGSRLGHEGRLRQMAALALGVAAADEPGPEDEDPGQALRLQLRLEQDMCTVSVDTSGALLYRRGYRQEVSRAPLRETLAAGMLELAGFRGDEPLWDPMCGSGTLLVEAAHIALNRAPGLDRSFAFERFACHDVAAWEAQKAQARAGQRERPVAPLWGSDLNAGALGTARRNARRAGVQEHLVLERQDVTRPQSPPTAPSGLLITNPPYGIRVGQKEALEPLLRALGALLRERLPGWRGAILVPQPASQTALGLELDDAFELQNGGIRCQLLVTARAG
jgi:putative N6-adenine-specific DNA methylase